MGSENQGFVMTGETFTKDNEGMRKFFKVMKDEELQSIIDNPKVLSDAKYSSYRILKPYPTEEIVKFVKEEINSRKSASTFIPL